MDLLVMRLSTRMSMVYHFGGETPENWVVKDVRVESFCLNFYQESWGMRMDLFAEQFIHMCIR